MISGFVGESFTTGRFLFPSENVIQDRNTYDTYFNGGITPILHIGANSIAFNGGLQYDIRRDTISPVYMSQNLFRQFLYISTSSFNNWVSFNGSGNSRSRTVHRSKFAFAGSFRNRGIYGGKAMGTHFPADRIYGARSFVPSARSRNISIPRLMLDCSRSSGVG